MGAEDSHEPPIRERIKDGILYAVTVFGIMFRLVITLGGTIRLDRSSKDGMPTDAASAEKGWKSAEAIAQRHDAKVRENR